MASTPSPSRGCAVSPRLGTALAPRLFSPPRRLAPRTRVVAAAHHARGSSRPAAPPRVVDASDRASSATVPSRGNAAVAFLRVASAAALALAPADPAAASSSSDVLPTIVASFNLATFTPQVFWFAMILAPRNPLTRRVMGSWLPVLVASGIHFYVDYVGFNQPGALEEAAKFGAVFDPTIAPWDWANGAVTGPLDGFRSMLENPNFVTEEWAHVLAWDLFVGRWMWLDAVERDVPLLWACLLTTNFTGPPGLLQYFLVCLLSGKGLPPADADAKNAARKSAALAPPPMISAASPDAGALVARLWDAEGGGKNYSSGALAIGWSASDVAAACAEDVRWEDLSHSSDALVGRAAVFEHLAARETRDAAGGGRVVVERRCDGRFASGFTWHRSNEAGEIGLRGTTFVEVDESGRIAYAREIAEPLVKPGGLTAALLKAVAKPPAESPAPLPDAARRRPATASDVVKYLWLEVQGASDFKEEALACFDDDVVYQDLNFARPFVGKARVSAFLDEFDIPGLTFVPDKISDGEDACCFTWEVDLGVEGAARVKGISFYACERSRDGRALVAYVRDIPESTAKPPPAQALAALAKPDLRAFAPAMAEERAVAEAREAGP